MSYAANLPSGCYPSDLPGFDDDEDLICPVCGEPKERNDELCGECEQDQESEYDNDLA